LAEGLAIILSLVAIAPAERILARPVLNCQPNGPRARTEETMATCPECDAEIEVDEFDVDKGDQLSCPECGSNLEVVSVSPLELDIADDDEDDEDDDDDDDLDDDEEGDDDDLDDEGEEDGDEEDEGWDE
jgi:alpha-aminoadipate/glutamate carrier protein LysW